MSIDTFYTRYLENGFVFETSILTRYCLSLYTKPFVILSGISGTGKTKIAQLFEVSESTTAPLASTPSLTSDESFIIMNITSGVTTGDGRGNFKFSDLDAIFEEDEIPGIKTKINRLREAGEGGNIIDPIKISIIGPDGTDFTASVYLQRASSPLVRVRFKAKSNEPEQYDSRPYLNSHFELKDTLKLKKIGYRKFEVDLVNNKRIKDLDEEFIKKEIAELNNKLFISVKSNWTDSTELFGYYNMLNDEYNTTNLLRFLLTAHEYPQKPFFLILDEMNLSKVEHYFSDFLSCLESRYIDKGELKQEAITLHNFQGYVNSDDDYFDLIPSKLDLPPNLYVTGTVNIDETTYMFSPKVLDRANVIEFNDINLENYSSTTNDGQSEGFKLKTFPSFAQSKIASRNDFLDSPSQFKEITRNLIIILQDYNLHFGYRVINEMALFINNALKLIDNQDSTIHQAIDIQILQKVLPKFSGAFGKLDEPLRKIIALLEGNVDYKEINFESINTIEIQTTKYPLSLTKLIRMYKSLLANGFASYLE